MAAAEINGKRRNHRRRSIPRPAVINDEAARGRFKSALRPVRYPANVPRPATWGDCQSGSRPCPWVSCAHNLYLGIASSGRIRLNFPHLQPHEMAQSCTLDIACLGEHTLDEIGAALNLTGSRAGTIESTALEKLRQEFDGDREALLEALRVLANRADAEANYPAPIPADEDLRQLLRDYEKRAEEPPRCPIGHALSDDNVTGTNGERRCLACLRRQARRRARRLRDAVRARA